MAYHVYVDDNFHFSDEDERHLSASFDNAEAALAHARKIVDDYLAANHKAGQAADDLYRSYGSFGEDPFIRCDDVAVKIAFSAWTYAKERCNQICSAGK